MNEMVRARAVVILGLAVGIVLIAMIMVLLPRHPSVEPVRVTAPETIECVLYWKNAPPELREGHPGEECAVSVRRQPQ